jgi:hypothetical protein
VSAVSLPYLAREGERRRAAPESCCGSIYERGDGGSAGSRVELEEEFRGRRKKRMDTECLALPSARKQNKYSTLFLPSRWAHLMSCGSHAQLSFFLIFLFPFGYIYIYIGREKKGKIQTCTSNDAFNWLAGLVPTHSYSKFFLVPKNRPNYHCTWWWCLH